MKELTEQLCRKSVALLESDYIDTPGTPPIRLSKAIEFCYGVFVGYAEECGRSKQVVYFDGKKNIRKRIRALISASKPLQCKIQDDLMLAGILPKL